MIFTCIYIYIISYNHIHSMSQLCGLWSIYTIFQHFNRCIFPASLFFNCKNQKKHISVPWLLSAVLQPLRFESSSGSVFYGRFSPKVCRLRKNTETRWMEVLRWVSARPKAPNLSVPARNSNLGNPMESFRDIFRSKRKFLLKPMSWVKRPYH